MQQQRGRKRWLGAVVLTVWALLVAVSPSSAQSPGYHVGVLTPGPAYTSVLEGLRAELARLGYTAGKNIHFTVEDTQGTGPHLADQAAQLAATKPDVLVAIATSHAIAAKQATSSIPIVFAWTGDPLRSNLIASYASSKNNLTGISNYSGPLSGKRLEVLREVVPGIKRILTVVATRESTAQLAFQFLNETAQKLGLELVRRDVTSKAEIAQIIQDIPPGAVDAICHVPSVLVGAHIDILIRKAKEERIPLIVHENSMVGLGALVSYGADYHLIGRQAGRMVAKILQGTNPSDIPTQTPERLILAINTATAKEIGLKIPRGILERTDRLFE